MGDLSWLGAWDDSRWSRLLDQAAGYDSYHLPGYHRLASGRGEGEGRLLVYSEGTRFVAVPMLVRPVVGLPGTGGSSLLDATSVYGYPGPIASVEPPSPAMLVRFRAAFSGFLRGHRIVSLFSRLHPLLDQAALVEGMGQVVEHGPTVSMDLRLAAESQLAAYRSNHRRDIKRLRSSGFACELDAGLERIDEFIGVYHETMRRVGAKPYYVFPPSYFEGLAAALGCGLQLILCRHEDVVVAAALFMVCGKIVQYHLGGTRDAWLRHTPLKLVFDEARALYSGQGAEVLHLGGGHGAAVDSLFNFKAGFSDRRHPFRSWRWVVLPDEYERLSALREKPSVDIRSGEGHFPAYRSP